MRWDLGFRVLWGGVWGIVRWGLGFRVLWRGVWGLGCRVEGSGVSGSSCRFDFQHPHGTLSDSYLSGLTSVTPCKCG